VNVQKQETVLGCLCVSLAKCCIVSQQSDVFLATDNVIFAVCMCNGASVIRDRLVLRRGRGGNEREGF